VAAVRKRDAAAVVRQPYTMQVTTKDGKVFSEKVVKE
jgi:uncharacterized protein YfaS (alpha-2-macroglobulin family)